MKAVIALLTILLLCVPASAQVPAGYEVIEISFAENEEHGRPRMNNCGEVIFEIGPFYEPWAEVFRYDNGALIQFTDNDVSDSFPDINDHGHVVRLVGNDGFNNGMVTLTNADSDVSIMQGNSGRINNMSHVAWYFPQPLTCLYESGIWFYAGGLPTLIDPPVLSNQSTAINDLDQVVWTRYDYSNCGFNWTSQIMFWSPELDEPVALPATQAMPQAAAIDNLERVAWSNFDHIEMWQDGEVFTFTGGSGPALNDAGDVAFQRKLEAPGSRWQIWLYLKGTFHQITFHAPPFYHSFTADLNDFGEVVWRYAPNNATKPSGVKMLQRIRNGDVNNDQAVDLADFAGVTGGTGYPSADVSLPGCLTGPVETDRLCDCRFFDLHPDRAVDLRDVAAFFAAFGQPVLPWPGNCCDPGNEPGCWSQGVMDCVCAEYPQCCNVQWTGACAQGARDLGCTECP